MAQWLVRRTWDHKVESSSPVQCTHVVFLGKTYHEATVDPEPFPFFLLGDLAKFEQLRPQWQKQVAYG